MLHVGPAGRGKRREVEAVARLDKRGFIRTERIERGLRRDALFATVVMPLGSLHSGGEKNFEVTSGHGWKKDVRRANRRRGAGFGSRRWAQNWKTLQPSAA